MIRRAPDFRHIVSWSVFLFWAGIFAIFYYSGDYTDFLNPQLGWLVLSAFILNLVFFLAIFLMPREELESQCFCSDHADENREMHDDHHHEKVDIFRLLVLLAPILFVIAFESDNLGQYAFEKRSFDVGRIDRKVAAFTKDKAFKGDNEIENILVASVAARLPKSVTLLDIHADFEKLIGQKLVTKGIYVADSPRIPPGTFVIFRFIMVCCVADAQPLAVLVKGAPPPGLKSENWIEIEGTLESTDIQGHSAAVIKADRIKRIPAPINPYLAPRMR
ncbi:MAG: TIGR03943 family protein [Candidatus Rifleibacteriota bacterium]